ncbi:MAG: hypothetical protein D6798_13440 [Deltaproteobacteria bacterium]|nr:MAG: hypothetical protein D6798_13440 [Deltaproteobacteria bacterium]
MSSLLLVALVAGISAPAVAGDCDVRALRTEIEEASPVQVGPLFVRLAACDADAARAIAPTQLLRILPGPEGDAAAVAAIDVGADDSLLAWTDGMISKDRSRTIAALGEACDAHPAVKQFLLGTRDRLGDRFWEERWYRALASCSGPEVGAVLAAELDKDVGADKTRYFGVLEAFARSQGAAAIPKLEELMGRFSDPEGQTYIINAFPDAAHVGSTEGTNPEAARQAVAAIERLAPTLTPKAVEAARVALQSLGADAAADQMAGERFRDRRQEDGGLLWGVVVVESAPCKKGTQTWRRVHSALVQGTGNTWPDQLQEKVEASATTTWTFDLGDKCRSESELKWIVPAEPFADEAAFEAWREEQRKDLKLQPADKSWDTEHEPLII